MQATRIIAIRHGETDWNAAERLQGHTDIPLNARGQWQAQRVAQALAHEDLDAIYSSDLARAHATAQAIASHNPRLSVGAVSTRTGLRERGFGVFEGQTRAQVALDYPDAFARWRAHEPDFAPPGGETPLQLSARVQDCVQTLASQHMGQHIVIVAHGGVLDALYRLATQLDMQAARTWALDNATINRLLWTPQGMRVVGWGDDYHFDDNFVAN